MCHGGDLVLRAGGEGDGGALACEETGRRRPDSASRAGYQRDATGVYRAFRHTLISAETYVLAPMDSIFDPRARTFLPLAYPTYRPAAEAVAAGCRAGLLPGKIEFSQRAKGAYACPTYPYSRSTWC